MCNQSEYVSMVTWCRVTNEREAVRVADFTESVYILTGKGGRVQPQLYVNYAEIYRIYADE